MSENLVESDETLYRSLSQERGQITTDGMGQVKLGTLAFADRRRRPSVDRAKLCDNDPTKTKQDARCGVISFLAQNVRDFKIPSHEFDVESKPLIEEMGRPANPAHAEIFSTPDTTDSYYKKVREKLAREIQFKLEIAPASGL